MEYLPSKKKKKMEYHQQRKKMNRIEKRATAITFKLKRNNI